METKPDRLKLGVKQSEDKAAYMRAYRARRGRDATRQQRAYIRALHALREIYPEEFERLYMTERAVEGLPALPSLGGPRKGQKNLQWLDSEAGA